MYQLIIFNGIKRPNRDSGGSGGGGAFMLSRPHNHFGGEGVHMKVGVNAVMKGKIIGGNDQRAQLLPTCPKN